MTTLKPYSYLESIIVRPLFQGELEDGAIVVGPQSQLDVLGSKDIRRVSHMAVHAAHREGATVWLAVDNVPAPIFKEDASILRRMCGLPGLFVGQRYVSPEAGGPEPFYYVAEARQPLEDLGCQVTHYWHPATIGGLIHAGAKVLVHVS